VRAAPRLPASASTIGTGDALDQLQRDHRKVEALFARAALEPAHRRETIAQIAQELSTHADLEEAVVYPAIEAALGAGASLLAHSEAEHDEMRALLDRLAGARDDDDADLDDLRSLQLLVQQHVAVEEGEVFPAYRQMATAADLERLDQEATRARADGAPSPAGSRSTEAPPAKKVAGAKKGATPRKAAPAKKTAARSARS
jgi:hemerythrin superfamily protein